MKLAEATRVHFIGIGGAGMSAIAKVLLERGVAVSGSDLKPSAPAAGLEAMGARVFIGHAATHLDGPDGLPEVVVVSAAVPAGNPELERAAREGIRVLSRGEALAALLDDRRALVVAGTHGKTTTTSMVVSVLRAAGLDPTYLVGGGLNDAGTNARHGRDDISVAESDESDGSFLLLEPDIAIITNVEADHLDYWGSADAVMEGFVHFMRSVGEGGTLVVPAASALVAPAAGTGRKVVTFGPGGDVFAEDVRLGIDGARFALVARGARAPVELRVPGAHNVDNALAAAASGLEVGVSVEAAAAGLSAFAGVERRFQIRGAARGVTVIDDYAHHPTEVRATLAAARPGPWRRLVAVFQPHRYSRTASLHRQFGPSFEDADRVVVTDVYGAGEQPLPGVTGKLIADAVCRSLPGRAVAYLPHRDELMVYLERGARAGDAVLTLGAGDITSVGDELLARIDS